MINNVFNNVKHAIALFIVFTPWLTNGYTQEENAPLFQQDFENLEEAKVPSDFLILEGDFSIQKNDGSHVLLLPGTPLSDYGVLFGPAASDGQRVSAKIRSERLKRQFPRFGVGLGGINGYKLFVTPSKRALEIFKDGESLASVPFQWKSGEWTHFRFQIQKTAQEWIVKGKAWQGKEEPKDWKVTYTTGDSPVAGKASIWGTPYSSHDILFDDIVVSAAS